VPLSAPQPVARGAMGEIFRVDVPQGSFALKKLFEWNPGTGGETQAAFSARARAAGVVTPVEVRAVATGELVAPVGVERYRVYSWLDLHDELVPPVAAETLVELGTIVGTLHAIAPETSDPVDDWYVTPPAAEEWHELASAASEAGASWAEQLAEAVPLLIAEGTSTVEALSLSPAPRLCHRDLDPTNVLPLRDGGLAVLDWENVGPLAPAHDLAMAVLSFVAADSDDVRRQVRNVRAGYVAAGGTVGGLSESSFAVALNTQLNFLHLQAWASVGSEAAAVHREFADAAVVRLLGRPDSRQLLPELVAGWAE
jgi:Ser/Thr protein kinase RdoA (MazF antagonist)